MLQWVCYQQTHSTLPTAERWPSHTVAQWQCFVCMSETAACCDGSGSWLLQVAPEACRLHGVFVAVMWQPAGSSAGQELHINRRFITAFTTAHPVRLLLSCTFQLRYYNCPSTYVFVCQVSPTKLCSHFSSSTIFATYPSLLTPAVITWIVSNHEVPLSLLPSGPIIFLSTLFSNTLSCHMTDFHMHVIKQAKLC